jgi:inhibitor of cysteine peptidase
MSFKYGKIVILITLLLLLVVQVQGLAPGRLTIYSTPSGAVACIDTVYCDTTDATFMVSGNAWHSIVVTNKGYLPWTDYIFVTSGHSHMVNAILDLNPLKTVLQVDITPGSGTVCLDSDQCHANVGMFGSSGSTQFTGVSPGYHTISVWSPAGYQDYFTTVYVDLAKSTYVTIDLKPLIMPATTITPLVTPAIPKPSPASVLTPVKVGQLVVTEEQNKATVTIKQSDVIIVRLQENPTTGNQWNLITTPGLHVISDNYVPSDTTGNLEGSTGTRVWYISANAMGEQKIEAVYKRSWEPVTGNESNFLLTVIVA